MLQEIMEMLQWLAEEVEYSIVPNGHGFSMVYIDTDDFAGFTEDWDEEYRDVDYAKIHRAKELLEHEAVEYDYSDDLYEWYYFSDCTVCWGATSYDI